jgi:DNA-binding MarR family transcriptional regulator
VSEDAIRAQRASELREIHAELQRVGLRSKIAAQSDFGLTPQQIRVVGLLALNGPMRSSDLAVSLGVARATVTGLLDRLEQAGLIARTADPDDGRSRLAEATARGRKALSQLLSTMAPEPDTIVRLLTLEELDCLVTGFKAMLRAISALEAERAAD